MRSYGLGIAFGMIMAAIFAFQNTADVVVRFLVWERVLPQGVWEVALFAAGAVAMWVISLSAFFEIKGRNSRLLKDQKETIGIMEQEVKDLRDERNTLIIALRKSGEYSDSETQRSDKQGYSWQQSVECYTCGAEETPEESEVESGSDDETEIKNDKNLFSGETTENENENETANTSFTYEEESKDIF